MICGPWDPHKAALIGRLKEQYKGKFAQPVRSAMPVGRMACVKQGAVHEQAHCLRSAPSAPFAFQCQHATLVSIQQGRQGFVKGPSTGSDMLHAAEPGPAVSCS